MGKAHKHLKQLKSEKAKVKLKAKKLKDLPKGLNVTNPSFKVKKIVIKEQLKKHHETEILSKRKLNIKDLLSRLQHHNSSVRQHAVKELKEILSEYNIKLLSSQFGSLLQGICALLFDKDRDIRLDSMKVLRLILGPVSNEQLNPYCDVLISYLKCAMTHINPHIKEDALLFLDVLMQNCSNILARNSYKVLPNFLDMISKLHTEIKPGRQLVTTLHSKNTNIKWRSKVLERLATMLSSIVDFLKSKQTITSDENAKVIHVNNNIRYISVYTKTGNQNCAIDFQQTENLKDNNIEIYLDAEEFMKYVELLMPLIFDSWIEVCPDEKNIDNSGLLISLEAQELLKSIVQIIQSIIECIDILNCEYDESMKYWYKNNFQNAYIKNLFLKFPYNKLGPVKGFVSSIRNRKRQEDFSVDEACNTCLGYNLRLCQIYVWFISIDHGDKIMPKLYKNYCTSVTKYINETLGSWSNINNIFLPELKSLLQTLFLKASKVWYRNHLSLNETLQAVVSACCNHLEKELQLQLFSVISDIMLDHTLHELHRESVFKEFITTLPNLLLKPKIHENTVEIINKIALRYGNLIRKELVSNYNGIIENAKKIEIIGSRDKKQVRLMICNLFYFLDTHIFY